MNKYIEALFKLGIDILLFAVILLYTYLLLNYFLITSIISLLIYFYICNLDETENE